MAMSSNVLKAALLKTGIAASVLLFASGAVMAQSAVTLTAAPTNATLPDGQTVPMWGYTCGPALDNGAVTARVSCTAANGVAQTSGWQPPLITVPSGQPLTITLVNNLTFGATQIQTSLVIVGQLGGGLGTNPRDPASLRTTPSPTHAPQGTTWPGTLGGTDAGAGDAVFTPPAQLDRVRSFATEVPGGATSGVGTVPALTWSSLRPGTYLIHSGTQPSVQGPMGLYAMLVVTDAAYPGQTFDKDVAALLSEIDPVQNRAVAAAVATAGFDPTLVWDGQAGKCGDLSPFFVCGFFGFIDKNFARRPKRHSKELKMVWYILVTVVTTGKLLPRPDYLCGKLRRH